MQRTSIVDAEKKRAVFLSVVGPAPTRSSGTLWHRTSRVRRRTMCSSTSYLPTSSQCHLRLWNDVDFIAAFASQETVATFVAELHSLSEYCNFGGSLDIMIRDCLVCGINDDAIQKRLLSESGLTYAWSVYGNGGTECARAENKGRLLEHSTTDWSEVHNVSGPTTMNKSTLTCFRCGKAGRIVVKCQVSRLVVCHQCGHPQRACKGQLMGSRPQGPAKTMGPQPVRRVQDVDEKEDIPLSPPIVVKLRVDNCLRWNWIQALQCPLCLSPPPLGCGLGGAYNPQM